MNMFTIAWKSFRYRAVSTLLTGLSVALGVMLMVAVLVIFGVLNRSFSQNAINYDLVIGRKGSPLQLVLSTVYRVGAPIENLPYRYYETIKNDPRVKVAIPFLLGDTLSNEEGAFKICGTVPEYFQIGYTPKRSFRIKGELPTGPFDAIVGQEVARFNHWDVGAKFQMVHGGADVGHVHNEKFTIVGILAATGTANDKTVFVNLDGFYSLDGHDKPLREGIIREREFFSEPPLSDNDLAKEVARLNKKYGHHHHDHDHAHDDSGPPHAEPIAPVQKEVTAILVQAATPVAAPLLAGDLKKGIQAQAVNPIPEMASLMTGILGSIQLGLIILTGLIILVSAIGIFVSIYNSMAARRREIGLYRALGASRQMVWALILIESAMICVGGGFVGFLAGHALVFIAGPIIEQRGGLMIDPMSFEMVELAIFPALLLLGTLAGIVPGLTAYRTDVASALQS